MENPDNDTDPRHVDSSPSPQKKRTVPPTNDFEEVLRKLPAPADKEKPVWPFRYFGDYSTMQDLVDSSSEMPKSSSRVGKMYQAVLPDFIGKDAAKTTLDRDTAAAQTLSVQDNCYAAGSVARADEAVKTQANDIVAALPQDTIASSSADKLSVASVLVNMENSKNSSQNSSMEIPEAPVKVKRKRGRPPKDPNKGVIKPQPRIPDRDQRERIFYPSDPIVQNDKRIGDYLSECISVFPLEECCTRTIDVQDRALEELYRAEFNFEKALGVMEGLTWASLNIQTWTPDEVLAFEDGVKKYGHDLELIRREV